MTGQTFPLVMVGTETPNQYRAYVPGTSPDACLAETVFTWQSDIPLIHRLGEIARAAVEAHPPVDPIHQALGRRLYDLVFTGELGKLWEERKADADPEDPLGLVLRIDPESARELLKLPWEYLHDGNGFLALDGCTPISRLPWGLRAKARKPLEESLRLLVVISAPFGLSNDETLDVTKEEDLILESTLKAQTAGNLEVFFASRASLEHLQAELAEFDPHILHFVGHGVFDELSDRGYLLMEDADGQRQRVENKAFAEILSAAPSLRLVFLSACQSAQVAGTQGFANLGVHLLQKRIPAVVAMQFSVFHISAMAFSAAFYSQVVAGRPLDQAAAFARRAMQQASPNGMDFATPALYLSDADCLRLLPNPERRAEDHPQAWGGVPLAKRFVGRSADLRELQTALDPEHGPRRAAVIHGLGGMGKTALAARLAQRTARRFDGMHALRVSPTTTAKDVLDQLAGFLLVNQAVFDHPAIARLVANKDQAIPLETKIAPLVEILNARKLLLIFDNYEDVLGSGQVVSQEAQAKAPQPGHGALDPELPKLIRLLLEGTHQGSRFVFTTRVDFAPLDETRLPGAVLHLSLEELPFKEAIFLMMDLPPLDDLPVAMDGRLSKREVYKQVGGHPYTLALLAEHANRTPGGLPAVLNGVSGLKGKLLAFTLLDQAAAQLPERARLLLRRAAVYRQPVPEEGLSYLLGEEVGADGQPADCMPDVSAEIRLLLTWGLLVRLPGGEGLLVPALVQDWLKRAWTEEEEKALLRSAADYWLIMGRDSRSIVPELNAREYLFAAKEYEAANDIVDRFTELLERWGQWSLLLHLLQQSADTLTGSSQAGALHNLGYIYEDLGAYSQARQLYQQSLKIAKELGNRAGMAQSLHQLGNLLYQQGDYPGARQLYQQSLKIKEELGDQAGMARSLHQLGMLLQDQGDYPGARQLYQQSLKIKEELGDQAGMAKSLHQLGNLLYQQGDYPGARQLYQQSLKIKEELGDQAGVARSLHQLGMLLEDQGEYPGARQLYQQSLKIAEELGDQAGMAQSLHQLGMLLQAQGDYPGARQLYQQSLKIAEELGDRSGMAISLHQLGMLLQEQGDYPGARQLYQQSLKIAEELGNRAGLAGSLHQLGMLLQQQGDYPGARQLYQQSLKIAEELGARDGIALSMGQLGLLAEAEGNLAEAVRSLASAFSLFQQLGSPDVKIAQSTLARLREKMGEVAFNEALRTAGVDPDSVSAADNQPPEDPLRIIFGNTYAVLTNVPEKRGEWWQTLNNIQAQAREANAQDDVQLFGLLMRVVEGAQPASLSAQVPAQFRERWDAFIQALQEGNEDE